MKVAKSKYVRSVAVRDDVIYLLEKRRIRVVDIALAAGLHTCTVDRVLEDPDHLITRETARKLERAYHDVMKGHFVPKVYRVGLTSQRGHPSTWTMCIWGHHYTEKNTYIDCTGKRRCRVCLAQRRAKWRAHKKLREAEVA